MGDVSTKCNVDGCERPGHFLIRAPYDRVARYWCHDHAPPSRVGQTDHSTTCLRAGCDEEVDRSEGVWPYCTKLCAAIDKNAGDSVPCFPRPPPVPVGLQGARTERPSEIEQRSAARCIIFEPDAPAILANEPVLSTDDEERKNTPIFSGVLNYFPLAIAAVARLSKRGNDKHNPGEPLHWQRDKSTDQEDCIARHLIDIDTQNPLTGEYDDAVSLAWRALAALQAREEKRLGAAMSRGSR